MRKTPDEIDAHVGARVRLRRTMLGLSQENLAEGLGVTFQQVQKYEKGTNRVGASRLQHIAAALDVPVSFFFEGSPGPLAGKGDEGSEILTQMMRSKDCVELTRAFLAIEDKQVQRNILALVRSLGLGKSDLITSPDVSHTTM